MPTSQSLQKNAKAWHKEFGHIITPKTVTCLDEIYAAGCGLEMESCFLSSPKPNLPHLTMASGICLATPHTPKGGGGEAMHLQHLPHLATLDGEAVRQTGYE